MLLSTQNTSEWKNNLFARLSNPKPHIWGIRMVKGKGIKGEKGRGREIIQYRGKRESAREERRKNGQEERVKCSLLEISSWWTRYQGEQS